MIYTLRKDDIEKITTRFLGIYRKTLYPQKPKAIIRALPERKEMEIRFLVITGYRWDNIEGSLKADYMELRDLQVIYLTTTLRLMVLGTCWK